MSSHTSFVGSIPDLYERYLGPVFMAPFARDLARRVAALSPAAVLEVACGTGILTRELVRIDATPSLIATDINEPMLNVARGFVPADRASWQMADVMALPFEDASFDAAACQFGVMFFPDKVQAAREVRRVLRPGGKYLFNVWGGFDTNAIARITHETVVRFFESDPPMFCFVPFGYASPDAIEADLKRAGFTSILVVPLDIEVHARSPRDVAIGLVQGSPMANAIRERAAASIEAVTDAVAAAIAEQFGATEVRAPMRALVVIAG